MQSGKTVFCRICCMGQMQWVSRNRVRYSDLHAFFRINIIGEKLHVEVSMTCWRTDS